MREIFLQRFCNIILFALIIFLASSSPAYSLTVDQILATVDDDVITLADYRQFVKGVDDVEKKDAVDETLLKKLVEERVILHEAQRKGIEATEKEISKGLEEFKEQNGLSSEDLEQLFKEEGVSLNDYRKRMKDKVMVVKIIQNEVDAKVVVSDKEIKDFYATHRKDFVCIPERVELKAIFLKLADNASVTEITDLKRRSLKISDLLKEGENFEKLVEEYSDEPLRSQGGLLGKFTRGALLPPLDKKAFSMKKGEISEPVWVRDGVYILLFVNNSKESYKPFEEAREDIYNNLYKSKRDKLFNEWEKKLWEKASVTIKEK